MIKRSVEVLIVGGGPAGISAAVAALSAGRRVTMLDDNATAGGQIWRAERGENKSAEAIKLAQGLSSSNFDMVRSVTVFDKPAASTLAMHTSDGRLEIEYEKLILATGARERFLPFPGWTLPNVFGAGGLQALVKGGFEVARKRVVIAGTGPLLLAVADHLRSKGAHVLLVAEQTSASKVRRFARALWRTPDKMVQAAALRARLIGIPYKSDAWVTSVTQPDGGDSETKARRLLVHLNIRGNARSLECDHLACGFHLVPNIELASLLGCRLENGFVTTDDLQRTSIENILCAGELTGIGGLEASLVEGSIAGLAAAGRLDQARELSPRLRQTHRFTQILDRTFVLRDELRHLCKSDTIICRCEDAMYKNLAQFTSFREAKLQTRCGMGPCQGRVCGPATQFLFGWEPPSVRPPIFPVKMENL